MTADFDTPERALAERWHAEPAGAVVDRLESSAARGPTGEEAGRRLTECGPNRLPEPKRDGPMQIRHSATGSPRVQSAKPRGPSGKPSVPDRPKGERTGRRRVPNDWPIGCVPWESTRIPGRSKRLRVRPSSLGDPARTNRCRRRCGPIGFLDRPRATFP